MVVEPLLDVTPPEANVSADAESGWTLVSVSPCVDGGDRHSQVVGEFLDGEKAIEVFHGLSMPSNPLTRIPLPIQFVCHSPVISTVSPGQGPISPVAEKS